MKTRILILLIFLARAGYSQGTVNRRILEGGWRFVPPSEGHDSTYLLFRENRTIEITFWNDSKETKIYGYPYSYYGFWSYEHKESPKKISELEDSGVRIKFFDYTGQSFDEFGNLSRATRSGEVTLNEQESSKNEPEVLRFYFNSIKDPDVYQRIDELPMYVIKALKENLEEWEKFILFKSMKKINSARARIYSSPLKVTKMYLIRGDAVEILEEKGGLIKIRFYGGERILEGWIKKSDVE